ncbi:TlpA family protein disulfide reductase [Rhodobacteraceae bacterium RKSG542]|uniref:thiol:disulfide interchange protein TlpA n=1 Tax=Pseudovibrio flavus TaxID=2529854 RepID=UPI0012BBADFD|nr:TlpA disulfide reductase family protein [Pseudovibrio flavus]MTI18436.1 TlpA family protein disulfide reductase [Pseudovibrio flavus]
MKKKITTESLMPRKAIIAGFLLIVGAGAGYFSFTKLSSTDADAATCSASLAAAKAVKSIASGEVAGFLAAEKPLYLGDLTFVDDQKNQMNISQVSQTRLMNLWATWCAPCRKEMPHLDKLQSEMGADDFEVVAVNVDRGENNAKPKAFLEEIGVTNLAYYNDHTMTIFQDLRKLGRAPGLPTTVLVGKDGCEIGSMFGPADWAAPEAQKLIKAAMEAQG